MDQEEALVRVHSRVGEEVTCLRKAARSAGTLRHMMEDSADGHSCPAEGGGEFGGEGGGGG